jgi:hypothetical protein
MYTPLTSTHTTLSMNFREKATEQDIDSVKDKFPCLQSQSTRVIAGACLQPPPLALIHQDSVCS